MVSNKISPPPTFNPQNLPVVSESLLLQLPFSLFSMEVFHGNPCWAGPLAGINTWLNHKGHSAKSCQMVTKACAT